VIEAARATMGHIDLDPASCEFANRVVQATDFYDQFEDGLAQVWEGNVWLNPPYGKDEDNVSNVSVWSAHLIDAYEFGRVEQALLLVNAVPDRSWFEPLWNYPICFFSARIKFYTDDGRKPAPTHANAVVYFGKDVEAFVRHFKDFGRIVVPQGDTSECLRND
jgi:ParB family chromosome partitioning protein